jgi:hypothetical protein
LTRLFVSGTGFGITGDPSLPHIVAPGSNVDFTVRFRPANAGSYSANLTINSMSVLLRGSSNPAAVLFSGALELVSGASVDFGRLERGKSSRQTFSLRNTTSVTVKASRLAVSGNFFRLASPVQTPLELAPGASADFEVAFEPLSSGIATGTLEFDRTSVRLTGTSTEPPFPRPSLVVEPAALVSGQQGRLSIRFVEPSRAAGNGTVRIEAQPTSSSNRDDALQFVTNGSRTVSFSVAEGDSSVRFGQEQDLVFQTGTTAGTIVFVVEAGGYTERLSVAIPPAPVKIDRASASRGAGSLDVLLTGFDNTRSASTLRFTFFDRGGQPVSPGAIPVELADRFRGYFDSSTLGGIFQLRAVFPVTGDAGGIGAVEVEITNASGTARTERLKF